MRNVARPHFHAGRVRRWVPAKLDVGDPLPTEIEVLPKPEVFMEDRCSVAAFPEGEEVEPGGTEALAADC